MTDDPNGNVLSDVDPWDGDEDEDEDFEQDDVDGNRVAGGTSYGVLEFLAHAIVDDPDAVVIELDERRSGVTLRLHVAPNDMGKVIGKRGRVAQAIRTLVRASGARDSLTVNVDIVD